jgi:hypothetical protein
METPALTMLFFGILTAGMGLTGLAAPQLLLFMLGIPSSSATHIFVMASSEASLAMGVYYTLAALTNVRAFFKWSVPVRILNFCVFTGMVIFGVAPLRWLVVAGLELIGAITTTFAMHRKSGAELDRFNIIRIASVTLAFIMAIPAFNWMGIYGSMSAFLVVSSAGFIYAYLKFPQPQDES